MRLCPFQPRQHDANTCRAPDVRWPNLPIPNRDQRSAFDKHYASCSLMRQSAFRQSCAAQRDRGLGQIAFASCLVPAASASMNQPGLRPRPDHVTSGFSGCRYFGPPVSELFRFFFTPIRSDRLNPNSCALASKASNAYCFLRSADSLIAR